MLCARRTKAGRLLTTWAMAHAPTTTGDLDLNLRIRNHPPTCSSTEATVSPGGMRKFTMAQPLRQDIFLRAALEHGDRRGGAQEGRLSPAAA